MTQAELQQYEEQARKHELEQKAYELASQLTNFVNVMGQEKERAEAFVQGMNRQHRTLQQGVMRLVVAYIEHLAYLAENQGQFDLRNEASVKLAKAVVATEAWQGKKYLPHI